MLFLLIVSTSAFSQDVRQQVFDELNAMRVTKHRAPLVYNASYQDDCDRWAAKLPKSFVHSGAKKKGETISTILGNPDLIIPQFMLSEPHKKILMDKSAKEVCISVYEMPADTIVKKNSVEYVPKAFYTVIRTY
ncbi:MAG: hypothetical protein QM762_12660 [Chryseolinea sp.]